MRFFLLASGIAVASVVLTYLLRRYALAKRLMDIPNARSSHSTPTPRGGGVAIVVSFLLGVVFVTAVENLSWSMSIALLGTGGFVALIGFLDDHGHIAVRWRLLAHFMAAFWALAWLGGSPMFSFFGAQLDFGWLGIALVAVYLVWLLNLYNFMDGIDGIASVEAICVSLGGALLYVLLSRPDLAMLPLMLAAAAAGFLYWNFPPARIFMGDAGSGFLGSVLGIMSIQAGWVEPRLFWCWVILLGVFAVDATFTLLRRLLRGDKVHEAHRSHAYQYASRQFGRHLPVTLFVGAINLVWLLPIALLVGMGRLDGVLGIVIAYMPLVFLATKFRAGEPETEKTA